MAIDITISSEPAALRREARAFAGEALTGVVGAIAGLPTAEERFDALRPFYAAAVAAGMLRAAITSLDAPGSGATIEPVVDELMAVDVNVPLVLVASALGAAPILAGGTSQQCGRLLAALRSDHGAPLAASALGDPHGAAGWAERRFEPARATVRREADHWVVSGWALDVTNGYGWHGQGADLYTVACRTSLRGPADETVAVVAVPGGAPGIHITGSRDPVGAPAVIAPRMHFDNVRVPLDNMIGEPGEGLAIVERARARTAAIVGDCARRPPISRLLGNCGATGGQPADPDLFAHQSLLQHPEETQRVHMD